MSERDLFDRILVSINEAALDDSRWPATSALLDEACGAKGNYLLVGEGKSRKDVSVLFTRFCMGGERRTDFEETYFRNYYPSDERVPRVRCLDDGQLVHVADLYTAEEKKVSRAYNECLELTETRNSLLARLDGPGDSRIIWTVADPLEGSGWRSVQVEMIKRVLPHVRNFVNMRQALADAGALGWSLAGLMDRARCGVLQLNRHGRIMEANDFAASLLRQNGGLSVRDGFLTAEDPSENDRLQKLVGRALPGLARPAVAGSATIVHLPGGPRLVLHASPLKGWQGIASIDSIAAIVLIVDPSAQNQIDPGLLQDALGLTQTESHVALLLASGLSVSQVALSTGRKESTVRWHMKHIFEKQGISRQAQLVRRVQALSGLSSQDNG